MFITESPEGKKPDCIMFGYDYIRYSETCFEWYYSFYVFIKKMQISSCFDYMWDFFFFGNIQKPHFFCSILFIIPKYNPGKNYGLKNQ